MSRIDADLEALKELREALATFTNRQKEALEVAEREINITITMVDEAERYRHYQVEECRHYLEQCQMEAAMAASEGYYVDCSSYAYALREAEENLANIQHWQRRVDETVATYHRGQGKIAYLLESDMWQAVHFLDNRIKALEAYYTTNFSLSSSALPVAASVVGAGIAGVINGVINAVQSSQCELREVLGNVGEEIAVQVLSNKFGLQQASAQQRTHGFGRVFSTPGIPLIVMEGKASRSTPGQEMGERITLLTQELGVENTPTVAVITDPVRGMADVYRRRDDGTWQLLKSDTPLNQFLPPPSPDSTVHLKANEDNQDDSTRKG